MGYGAKILLDSVSPGGARLTTWELTYPRFVHAELMTHREFSRNSASSRAIPNEKLRKRVLEDPALPKWWGKNQAGMQAREELADDDAAFPAFAEDGSERISTRTQAKRLWLRARDAMLRATDELAQIGLHKQLCNRLIEPWMYITVIVSSTNFENWFHLRDHRDAQPEIAWVAREMHRIYREATPRQIPVGALHLPFITPEDEAEAERRADVTPRTPANVRMAAAMILKKVSVGRCARVSYLTHDGKRDLDEDCALHDRLLAGAATGDPLHMSPFEHVARALADPRQRSGNFVGWGQYRKEIPNECRGAVSEDAPGLDDLTRVVQAREGQSDQACVPVSLGTLRSLLRSRSR